MPETPEWPHSMTRLNDEWLYSIEETGDVYLASDLEGSTGTHIYLMPHTLRHAEFDGWTLRLGFGAPPSRPRKRWFLQLADCQGEPARRLVAAIEEQNKIAPP